MAAKRDDKSFVQLLTPVHIDCFSFSVVTLIKVIDHQGNSTFNSLYQTVKVNSHYYYCLSTLDTTLQSWLGSSQIAIKTAGLC